MADLAIPQGFEVVDIQATPKAGQAPATPTDIPPGFVEVQHSAPEQSGGFNSAAGSLATGLNRGLIAQTLGLPVDVATGALNLGIRGINSGASALGYGQPSMSGLVTGDNAGGVLPLISNPVGGSESIRKLIAATVGETKPQGALDEALLATGEGIGSTAGGMMTGGALKAAGLLPRLLEGLAPDFAASLIRPGATAGQAIKDVASAAAPLAYGGAGGLGGYTGSNLAGQFSDDPAIRLLGATAGSLAAPFGMASLAQVPNAVRTLRAPFTDAGQKGLVGKILNETATDRDIANAPLSSPLGINPTFGQATNDPGVLALERSVAQRNPNNQGDFLQQQATNNDLVRGHVNQIGTVGNTDDISSALAARLDAMREAAQQRVKDAYQQVPADVTVPTQPLKDAFNQYVDSLTIARRRFVPDDYREMLMNYPDHVPMNELADLRSSLLADQRGANNSGDYNRGNVLGNIEQALFKGIPPGGAPAPSTPQQAATMAYQRASQESQNYHATFNQEQPIASIFQRNGTGGEKVLDSAVAQKMFAPGAGQSDRVNQFMKAAGLDPQATQAARDWFATQLEQRTVGAPQAGSSQGVMNAAALRRFTQQNDSLINSPIFSDSQRDAINNIVQAREILERTANGGLKGGSDTAAKLLGNNYLAALLGKWMGGAVQGIGEAAGSIGAAVGSHVGGSAGAAVGSAIGRATSAIPNAIYTKAGEQINDLLAKALRDPVLAQELMRKATPKGFAVTSPYLRSMLGLPGTISGTAPGNTGF